VATPPAWLLDDPDAPVAVEPYPPPPPVVFVVELDEVGEPSVKRPPTAFCPDGTLSEALPAAAAKSLWVFPVLGV
jgi:hypothetical protein